MTPRRWLLLGAVIAVGLALRVHGLYWGLPGQSPYYHGTSYHPDEQSVFYALRDLSWKEKRFYPKELSVVIKGTLQSYTVGVALALCSPWLELGRDSAYYQAHPQALRRIYVVGRLVSVLQNIAAVIALFVLGYWWGGWRLGFCAALLMSIAPVHVVNSHYISTDSAFCLYLILLAMAAWKISQKPTPGLYAVAGLVCGLLTANKYNAASTFLLILGGHLLVPSSERMHRWLGIALLTWLMGFALGCPMIVLGPQDYLAAIRESSQMNLAKHGPLSDGGFPRSGWQFYLGEGMLYGLGTPLALACLAAILYEIRKPMPRTFIWAPWVILFWILLMTTPWRLVRWIMPLTPFLFLLVGRLWTESADWTGAKQVGRRTLGVIVVFQAFLTSLVYAHGMATPDVRDTSSDWVARSWPKDAEVGFSVKPYLWDPTIFQAPFFHPGGAGSASAYKLVPLLESMERLEQTWPSYMAANNFHAGVFLRNPTAYHDVPLGRFYEATFDPQNYRVEASFEKRVRLGSFDWYGSETTYPHDWRYPFPKVILLQRVRSVTRLNKS